MLSSTRLALCASFIVAFAATAADLATGQSPTALDHARRKMEMEMETAKLAQEPSVEALDRKTRSVARLEAEGVPILDWLPVIETVAEARVRSSDEIARRALALVVVANKAEGADQALVNKLVADLGVSADLSPKEKAFIDKAVPTDHERLQFVWRYEALHVLLWSIGFVDKLDRPDKVVDVRATVRIFVENKRAGLIAKAKLRAAPEILDAADLIYRYHWAVRNAGLSSRAAPAGLNADVVMERHHALNWLIGYAGAEWDDVSTDT